MEKFDVLMRASTRVILKTQQTEQSHKRVIKYFQYYVQTKYFNIFCSHKYDKQKIYVFLGQKKNWNKEDQAKVI